VGVGSVVLGDEVGGAFHAPVSAPTEVACGGEVSRFGGDAGQRVEGEDLDVGVVVADRPPSANACSPPSTRTAEGGTVWLAP
jgi:hypothetical protein